MAKNSYVFLCCMSDMKCTPRKLRNFTDLLEEYFKEPSFMAQFLTDAFEDADVDVALLCLEDMKRFLLKAGGENGRKPR